MSAQHLLRCLLLLSEHLKWCSEKLIKMNPLLLSLCCRSFTQGTKNLMLKPVEHVCMWGLTNTGGCDKGRITVVKSEVERERAETDRDLAHSKLLPAGLLKDNISTFLTPAYLNNCTTRTNQLHCYEVIIRLGLKLNQFASVPLDGWMLFNVCKTAIWIKGSNSNLGWPK